MTEIVRLGRDQNARPNECGSCTHFRHRQSEYDTFGLCSFKLPPWVDKLYHDEKKFWEVDPRTVRDTDTCTLYSPRDAEFKQEITWKVEK